MKQITKAFANLNNLQKVLTLIIIAVVVYAGSASLSYSLFSKVVKPSGGVQTASTTALPGTENTGGENPSEPKTAVCPLNGSMHTEKAKTAWNTRRPLAVMIENHIDARPQSGLSSADVVYEAVAEGGITRFMALFYCNSLSDIQVGPVRSARTYFIDWLSEYNALYAHVGGANTPGPADALGQIITYKIKDLNQFSIGFPVYWRDYERLGHPVATEHTMYSTTQKLWGVGAQRGWEATDSANIKWDANFISWKFRDPAAALGAAPKITVNFWESQPDYTVEWDYDKTSNTYKRKNGGTSHIDLDNKQQLSPTNVVVQFEKEANANDGYPGNVHMLYGTIGTGKALFFQDGGVTEGKWIKASRLGRSKYVDSKGLEIQFDKGQIWIQTVPEGSKVTY